MHAAFGVGRRMRRQLRVGAESRAAEFAVDLALVRLLLFSAERSGPRSVPTLTAFPPSYPRILGIAGIRPREGHQPLTRTVLPQANAYAMIRRRAAAAGIETKLGNHSFRATGITAYLKNGGTLEKAAAMANHASTRTTQLYDRRRDEVSLDEVERIMI